MQLDRRTTYTLPTPVTTRTVWCSASATGGGTGLDQNSPVTLTEMRAMVVAGDLVYIKGNFTEQNSYLRVSTSPGGTAGAWIVYRRWPGADTPMLYGEPTAGSGGSGSDWAPFLAWGANYVVADGLGLFNTRNASSAGFARGSTNGQIINCALVGRGAMVGDGVGGSTDCWIADNVMDAIGSTAGNDGDGVFGQNGSATNKIVRNVILNCGHTAITMGSYQNPAEADVTDNIIAQNTCINTWAGGINLNGKSLRTIVEHNICANGGTSGLGSPGTEDGIYVQGVNNVVRYNICHHNDGEGIKMQMNVDRGNTSVCTGNKVYNNTLYSNGGAALRIVGSSSLNATTQLINNEIDNNLGWDNHKAGANSAGAFDAANYQMIWIDLFNAGTVWAAGNLGGNKFRNNGFARTTAADNWCIIKRTGGAGGDLTHTKANFESTYPNCSGNQDAQNPNFTDAANGNFNIPKTSYAVDKGFLVPGVAYFSSAPDIGAFEAGVAIAYDTTNAGADINTSLTVSLTPVGTPRGIVATVMLPLVGTDVVTGVTYGGVAMARVGSSIKAAAESMGVYSYFLGSGVPTGVRNLVVTLSGSQVVCAVVSSLLADGDIEVVDSDTTINSSSLANPSVALQLLSRESFVMLGFCSGQDTAAGVTELANWTNRFEGAFAGTAVGCAYTYNVVGTVDVTAGWTQTAEDAVGVGIAVALAIPAAGGGSAAKQGKFPPGALGTFWAG